MAQTLTASTGPNVSHQWVDPGGGTYEEAIPLVALRAIKVLSPDSKTYLYVYDGRSGYDLATRSYAKLIIAIDDNPNNAGNSILGSTSVAAAYASLTGIIGGTGGGGTGGGGGGTVTVISPPSSPVAAPVTEFNVIIATGGTAQVARAAKADRGSLTIINTDPVNDIWFKTDGAAGLNKGFKLPPSGSYEFPGHAIPNQALSVWSAVTGATCAILESNLQAGTTTIVRTIAETNYTTAANTAANFSAANTSRSHLGIQNTSTVNSLWFRTTGTAALNAGILLPPSASYEWPAHALPSGALSVWSSAATTFAIMEA